MDQRTVELLAGFAHAVRAPLGAISGYTELLRMGAHGPVSDGQAELLERILRNQRRVVTMLDGLLSYGAAEAGTAPVLQAQPVLPLIREVVARVESPSADRGIAVHLVADGMQRYDGLVDPPLLGSVLALLLDDALCHTSAGGDVQVVLGVTERALTITISSASPPVSPDALESLFIPFHRTSDPHSVDSLSLPTARVLARRCGGELVASSAAPRRTLQLSFPSISLTT